MRALLVEGDPVTRRSVAGLFVHLGFGVVDAAGAPIAEQTAGKQKQSTC